MKNKTCGECKHFEVDTVSAVCEKKRWICGDDAPACNRFEQKSTLFDRITQSPETLANEFVSFDHGLYYSWFLGQYFNTYTDAIAATVEKLKEVEE